MDETTPERDAKLDAAQHDYLSYAVDYLAMTVEFERKARGHKQMAKHAGADGQGHRLLARAAKAGARYHLMLAAAYLAASGHDCEELYTQFGLPWLGPEDMEGR